jgi:hypothetical protein
VARLDDESKAVSETRIALVIFVNWSGKHPLIFVPKTKFSTLSVSCRQIQSVTEEEAERSGSQDPVGHWKPVLQARFTERDAFKQIMERVERGSWERNEWFWAIEAKEVK